MEKLVVVKVEDKREMVTMEERKEVEKKVEVTKVVPLEEADWVEVNWADWMVMVVQLVEAHLGEKVTGVVEVEHWVEF